MSCDVYADENRFVYWLHKFYLHCQKAPWAKQLVCAALKVAATRRISQVNYKLKIVFLNKFILE